MRKIRFSILTNPSVTKRVNTRKSSRENRKDRSESQSVEICFIPSSKETEKISQETAEKNPIEKKDTGIIFQRRKRIPAHTRKRIPCKSANFLRKTRIYGDPEAVNIHTPIIKMRKMRKLASISCHHHASSSV